MPLPYFLFFSVFAVLISCNTTRSQVAKKDSNYQYSRLITAENLKKHLYVFAGDEMEGRMTGTEGQRRASRYIRDFYIKEGIASPLPDSEYFQEIPASYFMGRTGGEPSENVLAYIPGTEKPEEVIVLSAHLDHIGMDEAGNIYNGADDDGSGTVALLEIAKAFKEAGKAGHGPRRSVLFLHVTGEEIGLFGSRYYVENPVFPLQNTVCNLNMDMIGRIDPEKADNPFYLYLIGSNMLSQDLQDISNEVNKKYIQMELDYKYDDPDDPNRFYYRSDHYNFAKNNIPVIFYFNGVHEDYHQLTDTPDKIEYELMAARAQLIFLTAWEVANRAERIKLNN